MKEEYFLLCKEPTKLRIGQKVKFAGTGTYKIEDLTTWHEETIILLDNEEIIVFGTHDMYVEE